MKWLRLLPMLLLAACVQTGGVQRDVDYSEAARINTQLGLDYLRQGNLALAQSKLEKALKQDNDLADTHIGLALVHARYGEEDKARQYFDRALRLAPNDPGILNNFGAHLCAKGQAEKAETYFLRALKEPRYSTPEVAYNNAGVCYLRSDDADRAEAFFREALRVKPDYAPALFELAAMHYRRGDLLRASAFLQRLEAASTPNIDALLLGLRLQLAQDDRFEARRYADKLRQLDPAIDSRFDLATGRPW